MVAKRPKRLSALSGKECRVECLRLIPFVENDQVELELVVDTREHTHLVVKLNKCLELTYVEQKSPHSGRALGLVQSTRHHHTHCLAVADELPRPLQEKLKQVGIASCGFLFDRDFAVVPLDFLFDLGGLIPSPGNSLAPVPRIVSIGQDRLGVGITPGA